MHLNTVNNTKQQNPDCEKTQLSVYNNQTVVCVFACVCARVCARVCEGDSESKRAPHVGGSKHEGQSLEIEIQNKLETHQRRQPTKLTGYFTILKKY